MGLRRKPRPEGTARPGTESGCDWSELDAQGKGEEFDASLDHPREYADENFSSKPAPKGRHRSE